LEYGRSRAGRDRQTYVCAEHFGRLSTLGWTDVWRHHIPGITEYTWYSNLKGGARGNGFSSQILRMPSAYTCDWLPISNTSSWQACSRSSTSRALGKRTNGGNAPQRWYEHPAAPAVDASRL